MGCRKSNSKREVFSNTILPHITRKTSNRQPNFTPKTTGRRRTKKNPQISRRNKIIKIQAKINEKEMKETIVKINTTKSCSSEKINKIDKTLVRLIKKKKREESNQQNYKRKRRGYNRQCRNTKDYETIMNNYIAICEL